MKFHNNPKYKGIIGSFTTIVQEEGILALWKGNFTNVIRVIPNYALKFAFNDWIKLLVTKPGQKPNELSFSQLFMSGSGAGLIQTGNLEVNTKVLIKIYK